MSESESRPVSQPYIEDLVKFETNALNHVNVNEKVKLPSKEDIESEKQHISLVSGVENFDKNKLKPTKTEEKIVLPSREVIENEKKGKVESEI